MADKKEIANAAALQIGAASMGSPNGMDANDLLQAGQLGAWFEYTFKRLGLTFPAEPVTESVTSHQSPVTDSLLTKADELSALTAEQKAQPLRPVDTLLIHDAQPFDFDFGTEQAGETLPNANIDADPAPLPPMRMVSKRPALPRDLWLGGLSPAEALAAHARLKQQYFCTCGADAGGWFVRCDPVHYAVEVAPTAEFSAMPVQR